MPPSQAGRDVRTNAELAALHAVGTGFVYSHYSSGASGSQYNRLHAARCDGVGKMIGQAKPESRPTFHKMIFPTLDEALGWLVPNRGPEGHGWRRCRICQPGHPVADGSEPREREAWQGSVREAKEAADPMSGEASMVVSGSWPVHAAFAMPSSPPLRLPLLPRLASWNKGGDPDQVKLAAYLDVADEVLRPYYERLSGQVALRLDVGLPQTAALLDQRDLDNYLFPLATHLSRRIPGTLACAWGTKQRSASSFVRIEQSVPAGAGPSSDCCYTVRTTAFEPIPRLQGADQGPAQHRQAAPAGPDTNAAVLFSRSGPELDEPMEAGDRCPRSHTRTRSQRGPLGSPRWPHRGPRAALPGGPRPRQPRRDRYRGRTNTGITARSAQPTEWPASSSQGPPTASSRPGGKQHNGSLTS